MGDIQWKRNENCQVWISAKMSVSDSFNPKWAVSGTSNRYQSHPSLHTSSPVLKSTPHMHSNVDQLFPSCGICVSVPTAFHTPKGKIDCTQETKHSASHRIMNQWAFLVLDCEPRSETSKDFSWWLRLVEKDGPPHRDDFTNLLHPTLQTKSSFFVLKVENIMIELTIYIYTPYMLNTVNIFSFLVFDFRLLFVTGDCTRVISGSSF